MSRRNGETVDEIVSGDDGGSTPARRKREHDPAVALAMEFGRAKRDRQTLETRRDAAAEKLRELQADFDAACKLERDLLVRFTAPAPSEPAGGEGEP